MKRIIMLALAAFIVTATVAGASSSDKGRRLAGPFCVSLNTGVVRSVAVGQDCKAGEVRKVGLAVTGPRGPVGPKGADGKNGVDGKNGGNGSNGSNGAKGDTGAPGAPGATGATGAKGATGATGANGTNGTNGAKGDPGVAGAKGDPGSPGAKGDTGSQGIQGIPGSPGTPGTPGAKGDKGDKGDPGTAAAVKYAEGIVQVKRGAGAFTTWATYSTSLGSPYGDTASGTFRFTCSEANAPCSVKLSSASTGVVTVYPRVLIYKSSLDTGQIFGQCEYGDGADNAGSFEAIGDLTVGIGGSLDCGSAQAYPVNGIATQIDVPAGYYDVFSTFTFKP